MSSVYYDKVHGYFPWYVVVDHNSTWNCILFIVYSIILCICMLLCVYTQLYRRHTAHIHLHRHFSTVTFLNFPCVCRRVWNIYSSFLSLNIWLESWERYRYLRTEIIFNINFVCFVYFQRFLLHYSTIHIVYCMFSLLHCFIRNIGFKCHYSIQNITHKF